MASSVATPLEKQFSTIPGIEAMTSTSGQGSTQITLQFALSRDIDAAAQDVQAAISQAQRQLPQEMLPPSYRKVDPSSQPILYYALRDHDAPAAAARRVRRDILAQRLSTIDGVAQVQVYGSQKYAVRIQLDPQQLAARNIGIDEVRDRGAERQRQPADRHPVGHRQGLLGGEPGPAHQRRGLRRAGRGLPRRRAGAAGATWAGCIDSVQDTKQASWFNGQRAIVLAIQRQPGTNTVAVAAAGQGGGRAAPAAAAGLGGDRHAVRPLAVDRGSRWPT